MKIVLLNQSLYSEWQIPSLAANLSRAAGDVVALNGLGVQHGINSGTASSPPVSQTAQTVTQWVLGPEALVFPEGSFRRATTTIPSGYDIDMKWFGHDIEVEGLVKTIRHGPGVADQEVSTNGNGQITLPYARTDVATRATKTFFREVAWRHGLDYDETSPTFLKSGDVTYTPTYGDLWSAAIDCMRNTHAELHDSIWTGAGKETVFYHSMGVNPLPWIGSGWWLDPFVSIAAGTYRPNRTTAGHLVTQLNVTGTYSVIGSPIYGIQIEGSVTESTGEEGTSYEHAAFVPKLVEQCAKTAEHARAFDDGTATRVGCVNYNVHISKPLNEVWSSVTGVSGTTLFPVGGGGGGLQRYCPTEQQAADSVYLANRYTYLGAVKQFGNRTAVWLQPAIDFWATNDPYWGLMASNEDFIAYSIDALVDPVTAEEAAAFGLQQGCTYVPGSVIFWNATDNYLRSLFGEYPSAAICRIRDGAAGEFLARRNMASRAAGRTNVAVDWTTPLASNQWYQALASILTDDMFSRIEATKRRLEKAQLNGAARRTTLISLTGG